jgi:hypothetical protein
VARVGIVVHGVPYNSSLILTSPQERLTARCLVQALPKKKAKQTHCTCGILFRLVLNRGKNTGWVHSELHTPQYYILRHNIMFKIMSVTESNN